MISRLIRFANVSSFRSKLFISAIACIVIPAFISLAASNYFTKDAVKEQAEKNAVESLQLVNGHVSNTLENLLYIANSIHFDPAIKSIITELALGKTYEGSNADYRKFEETKKIIEKLDNLTIIGQKILITILLPNGIHFTNIPTYEFDPLSLFQQTWFEEMNKLSGIEAKWIGSKPHPFMTLRNEHLYQIFMGRTLRFANNDIYGYVIVSMDEKQITQIFDNLGEGQEMFLLNETSIIMSHRDSERIGMPFSFDSSKGTQVITKNGETFLLAEQPLSAIAGWRLVSLTPYKDAVAKINNIYNTVLIFQLFFFFIFLVILILLLRKFTIPLVKLGRLADVVQRGNLEMRSSIQGTDEIGRLGRSFDQMLDRIKDMIHEITIEQNQKRKAELAMLQSQINPHFLFNVLNSIRMKVLHKGDRESANMISSLSKLMRMTIETNNEDISLHDEIELVIDYIKLMNLRQKEKVELETLISADTFMEKVPRFILQPIIENAMIHGFNQHSGSITIQSTKVDNRLFIIVKDDGQGMDIKQLEALRLHVSSSDKLIIEDEKKGKSSIGLRNVFQRMRIRYGDEFKFQIESEPGKGTTVELNFNSQELK